jgi:hypothetical protein
MSRPKPVIAQFIGSDLCTAEGLEVKANAPGLAMCRRLVEAGFEDSRPLHCYRGGELAMKISSIGWGAKYAIEEGPNGPKLRKWKPVPTGVIASHVDLPDAAE